MLKLISHALPDRIRGAIKRGGHLLPPGMRGAVRDWWSRPPRVSLGGLRRLEPVSRVFGLDRGLPIDRYYIEGFLHDHAGDVRGRTLEIVDAEYTRRFGGSRVTRSDVLHAVPGNPEATLVGDLVTGEGIPCSAFDCLIVTQTLQFLRDPAAGVLHAWSALKPGGVLLATFPGISQISRYDADRWGDYWRFTEQSAALLFGDRFGPENITVRTYGNVLTACAFLQGLAACELTRAELDHHDRDYPVLVTVRAVKNEVAR
jgi:hypothetical protein